MADQPFKRLRASEEVTKLTWRGSPKFTDWTLTWGADLTFQVHRVIIAGGSRPAHFFIGATNEDFKSSSTDLSKVLPPRCKTVLEIALDFIYGETLISKAEELPLLYKLADVLQCPTLQNSVLDELAEVSKQEDKVDALVDAVLDIQDELLMQDLMPLVRSDALRRLAPKLVKVFPRVAAECIRRLSEEVSALSDDSCLVDITTQEDTSTDPGLHAVVGTYRLYGLHHSKPVYKKVRSGENVFLYYFCEHTAGRYYTWWIGPEIGADMNFAGNATPGSTSVPIDGWRVPWDADIRNINVKCRCLSRGHCPHVPPR